MRNLILIFALFFSCNLAFSQGTKLLKKDLLIMKDGSRIEGDIVELEKKFITINIGDETTVKILKKNVYHISQKGTKVTFVGTEIADSTINPPEVNEKLKFKLVPVKQSEKEGLYNITYGGIYFPDDSDGGGAGVENITGYQINQYTGIGLGIAFQSGGYYLDGNIVPVFAEYRGYFGKKKVSAYYSVAMGASFGAKKESSDFTSSKPGGYFHPAIGYKVGSNDAAFMIDIGLHYSTTTFIYDNESFYSEERNSRRSIVLRIGVML